MGPIREAITALDLGEHADAQTRVLGMLTAYGTAVAGIGEPVELSALPDIEAEIGNLRHWLARSIGSIEGLELATSVSAGLVHLGIEDEALRWLEKHRGATPHRDALLDARSLLALCNARGFGSGPVATVEELRHAVATADECGNTPLSLVLQGYLVLAIGWSGDIAGAIALTESGKPQIAALGDEGAWYELHRRRLVVIAHIALGDFHSAVKDLAEIIAGFDATGHPLEVAMSRYMRANAARLSGDTALAREELVAAKQSLAPFQAVQAKRLIGVELAELARDDGDPNATNLLADAIVPFERAGNLRMSALHRQDLGRWRLKEGDESLGRQDLRKALPVLIRKDARAASVGVAALARLIAAENPEPAVRLATAAKRWLDERPGLPPSESDLVEIMTTASTLAVADNADLPSDDEVIQLVLTYA
jgi:hypothetical protein